MFRPGARHAALLYAGTVVGAGFASGQEILRFFGVYGVAGVWGVAVAALLFAYLGAAVLTAAVRLRATSYRQVLNHLLGRPAAGVMDFLALVMLVAMTGVMLAGSGAVFQEQFGLPPLGGVLVLATLICAVIITGLSGLVAINAFLVPLKITLVTAVCLAALLLGGGPDTGGAGVAAGGGAGTGHWLLAAVLYVSYNLVAPVAVLSSLGCHLSPEQAVLGGAAGGLLLGAAAGVVTLAVVVFYPALALCQLPILFLAGLLHPAAQLLIAAVVWVAIFTTAIANAHGFASRIGLPGSRRYRLAGIGLTLAVVPLALADFATLIRVLYPLFGYGGLILVAALLWRPLGRVLALYHEKNV